MTPLVDTAWLASALGPHGPALLDATYYLPHEGIDPRARFAEAHLPGARFLDIDAVADADTDLPHMVPSPGRFGRAMQALGIAPDRPVVIYDQRGLFSSARGWWLLRLFGHESVAVLDGGLPAWREAGLPLESGASGPPDAPRPYTATFHARRLAGAGDLLANLEAGNPALVLDARPALRFTGEAPEPRAGLASGHIPGARNLPASELTPGGRLLPPEALRARFAALGADGSRPVITSCGSGVTAAILTLGLAVAGLPEGALYDGSWAEWGARPDLPKTVGP